MRRWTNNLTAICLATALFADRQSAGQSATAAQTDASKAATAPSGPLKPDLPSKPLEIRIRYVYENNLPEAEKAFSVALNIVMQYPPENGENPFNWPSSVSRRSGVYTILCTSMADMEKWSHDNNKLVSALFSQMLIAAKDNNADAFSFRFVPQNSVMTVVLLDKILWTSNHAEDPLGLEKLATICAHEIYGNGANILRNAADRQAANDPSLRLDGEIHAFQAGIDFGNKFAHDNRVPIYIRTKEETVIGLETRTLDKLKELKGKSTKMPPDELNQAIHQIFQPPG